MHMETDDHAAEIPVPEPPLAAPPVPPPQLTRHRIYGKRGSAVEHERSVKLRIGLPEEDELFVSSVAEFSFESKFENMSVIMV